MSLWRNPSWFFSEFLSFALLILYYTSFCRRLTLPNQFLKCVRAISVCENTVHNSSERNALSNTRSSLPRYESEMSIFDLRGEPALMSFTHLPFAGTRKKKKQAIFVGNLVRPGHMLCFLKYDAIYLCYSELGKFRYFEHNFCLVSHCSTTMAIRTTVVPIRILIRTTVVPIRILIRTTAIISTLS